MSSEEFEAGRDKAHSGFGLRDDMRGDEYEGYRHGQQERADEERARQDSLNSTSGQSASEGSASPNYFPSDSGQGSRPSHPGLTFGQVAELVDNVKNLMSDFGVTDRKTSFVGIVLFIEDAAFFGMLMSALFIGGSTDGFNRFVFGFLGFAFGIMGAVLPFMLYKFPKFRAASLYVYPALWVLTLFLLPGFRNLSFSKVLWRIFWTVIFAAASYGLHYLFIKGCTPKSAEGAAIDKESKK
jgi:hypothetical protein